MTEQLTLRISVPLLKKRILTPKKQINKRIFTISLVNPPRYYKKRTKKNYTDSNDYRAPKAPLFII